MASEIAKKVAGTYIVDGASTVEAGVLKWFTAECRSGVLKTHVQKFCEAQEEVIDPALVVVEAVSTECIQCKIPCRLADHESDKTFLSEVKFSLNPVNGKAVRVTLPI